MSERPLAEGLDEMLSADRISLPVYPAVARRVRAGAGQTESFEALNHLVKPDPGLVCTLFRAANSSFFQGLKQTTSLEDAMTRLGRKKTLQILNEACGPAAQKPSGKLLDRYLPNLWRHALGCAIGAEWLAKRCGYQGISSRVYLAGLLHDVGKLLLIAGLDRMAREEARQEDLSDRIILEILETMHTGQGRRLAELWNLPACFLPIIVEHHAAEFGGQDILSALVRLANKGCHKVGLGWEQDRSLVLPTTAEAQFLGISEIALAELEIMLEDRFFVAEENLLRHAAGQTAQVSPD